MRIGCPSAPSNVLTQLEGWAGRLASAQESVRPGLLLRRLLPLALVLMSLYGSPVAQARGRDAGSNPRYTAVSVAAGNGSSVCALTTGGIPVCWDDSYNTYIAPSGTYTQISVGGTNDDRDTDNFACGLRRDGAVRCWSVMPRLGSNMQSERVRASAYGPQPSGTFVYVASGPDDACGIRAGGRIYCWLDASNMGSANPLPEYRFSSISLGGQDSGGYAEYAGCGVRRGSGELACWGKAFGTHGRLPLSVANPPRGRFLEVASPYQGACALRSEGTIVCWRFRRELPAEANPHYRFAEIAEGCGLRRNHRIWCEAGLGGGVHAPGHQFRQFAEGGAGLCAVQLDGTLHPVSERVGSRTEPSICQPPQYGP